MAAKQRVNGFIIKILYGIYKLLGYNLVYYSLYLVVLYYFLFATNVREALKKYYSTIGVKFSNRRYFNHLFNYAVSTSDRFIAKANPELYCFEYTARPTLIKEIKSGSLLLLSHFGGWATASNCFNEDDVKINVVMNEAMIASAAAFEKQISKKHSESTRIINLSKGSIAASIEIANALSANESVALMGDRALHNKHLKPVEFFGKQARFNANPFLIAYKTKKIIVPLFVMLTDKKKYRIKHGTIELKYSLPCEEAVEIAMKEYVAILTEVVSEYPLQWFNFYDFWNPSGMSAVE
jgi:predicted LPLAT superfamily acyltransferase